MLVNLLRFLNRLLLSFPLSGKFPLVCICRSHLWRMSKKSSGCVLQNLFLPLTSFTLLDHFSLLNESLTSSLRGPPDAGEVACSKQVTEYIAAPVVKAIELAGDYACHIQFIRRYTIYLHKPHRTLKLWNNFNVSISAITLILPTHYCSHLRLSSIYVI